MDSNRWVMGIDGGGSKTVAVLSPLDPRDDSPPAFGISGPSNIRAVGIERATQELDAAVASAYGSGKPNFGSVECAVIGTAGAGREHERRQLLDWAERVQLAKRVHITHDGDLALSAGTEDGIGVALISGTGSFAFGRNQQLKEARGGGWGYLIGDEGSGFAIGLGSLRAIASAQDGIGPATSLTGRVLKQWDLDQPSDLIRFIYTPDFDRRKIAQLAPLVLELAEQRDEVAVTIIDAATQQLARLTQSVAHQLSMQDHGYELVLAGGVLSGSQLFSQRLEAAVQQQPPRPQTIGVVQQPVQGAIRIARRYVGNRSYGK